MIRISIAAGLMNRLISTLGTWVAVAMLVAASQAGLASEPALAGGPSSRDASLADRALERALSTLVAHADGPPGIAVVVQRGRQRALHTAGVADLADRAPIRGTDNMRMASVSKAFSGAVALSLVAAGRFRLTDTIGRWLPNLPPTWSAITLRELLQRTSGIPDFSKSKRFIKSLTESLLSAPPPEALLSYVQDAELEFTPGTRFQYSNSDNIVIGLMIEAATGRSYEAELAKRVFTPMGLARTSLPSGERIAPPLVHGYEVRPPEPPDNISELFAAGWTWASGGILSTPFDADRFIRAYARGAGISAATRAAQLRFVPGSSEPPGPGQNAAGLAIFRYRTTCGTVYGHTGNTAGYTQFVAASRDGSRSTVVSVNAQITPSVNGPRFVELRHIYTLAVCAALAR